MVTMFSRGMICDPQTKMFVSAAAGAAVCTMGYDRLIPQLPPMVHHALAGVAVDAFCTSSVPMQMESLYSAMAGMAGAYGYKMLVGKY